jgi:hypothetical protein
MRGEGDQDGKAYEAQKSFSEFVKASGDSTVTLEFLEEVFHSMTTPVELCGKWYRRSAVSATRNAGFNSLGGRCLSEGGAIIGFVANKGRILWQALRELFSQKRCRLRSHWTRQ